MSTPRTAIGVTPLVLAATNGNAAAAEILLRAGADPNMALAEGETVLMTAARSGQAAMVKALVARGAKVNATEGWQGQTALMWAAAENHGDVVSVLVEAGADPNLRSKVLDGMPPLRKTAPDVGQQGDPLDVSQGWDDGAALCSPAGVRRCHLPRSRDRVSI